MSKKSYKQLQNRLYREIKRRIIAEQTQKIQVETVERDVVTLRTKYISHPRELQCDDAELLIKGELAQQLLAEILSAGYITFYSLESHFTPDQYEFGASIDVVPPKN